MTDLIKRQDAIDAMMALKKEDDEMYSCNIPECFDGVRAAETLRKLPAVEPEVRTVIKVDPDTVNRQHVIDVLTNVIGHFRNVPSVEPERKKGHWIYEEINTYTQRTYCSECGMSAPFVCKTDDHYGTRMHGETMKTNFCPHCGAEMRSGNE